MAFSDTKMLLYTQSRPKIIHDKQVSTSIHKIYPYKLYKCTSILNTPIWDSVQLHPILIFGQMGVGAMGQSKYTSIICTILKKTAMKFHCKMQVLGNKIKQVKDHSRNEIKTSMQTIEEANES